MTATAIRERPIVFSGPEVRACLDGRKTQVRRMIKPQPRPGRYGANHPTNPSGIIGPGTPEQFGSGDYCVWEPPSGPQKGRAIPWTESCWYRIEPECPHGEPGERLWVRETFSDPFSLDVECKNFTGFYRASDPGRQVEWRPSTHMPRWASRLTLEIVEVRVEKLQTISSADCIAEGISPTMRNDSPAKDRFFDLWESINGKGSWNLNPWVWAISFRVLPREATP